MTRTNTFSAEFRIGEAQFELPLSSKYSYLLNPGSVGRKGGRDIKGNAPDR